MKAVLWVGNGEKESSIARKGKKKKTARQTWEGKDQPSRKKRSCFCSCPKKGIAKRRPLLHCEKGGRHKREGGEKEPRARWEKECSIIRGPPPKGGLLVKRHSS